MHVYSIQIQVKNLKKKEVSTGVIEKELIKKKPNSKISNQNKPASLSANSLVRDNSISSESKSKNYTQVQISPVIPTLGKHIIVELSGCSEEEINDILKVEDLMNQAAKKANANIIKSVFHKFSPMGVSGVVVISESHLSIHTWPELGYAAIDIYTCGSTTKPFKACYFLAEKFKAKKIKATYIIRGIEKKSKNNNYNFYTHKIKMVEGNVNTLKILPTLVKKIPLNNHKETNINKPKNNNKDKNNILLLAGEK